MTINGTAISMTRGDSETLTVKIKDDAFEAGDKVTFTARARATAPIAFQIVVTEFEEDGSAIITFDHETTEGLTFGRYMYDIELVRADGTVTTLIKPAAFDLTEEVTY